MAITIGDLLVRLGLDASSLTAGLGDINKQLSNVSRDVQKEFGGIQKAAQSLQAVGTTLTAAITLPIVGLGTAAVKAAADLDALKRGLATVAGGAEQAERQFVELRQVAQLPGLGLKEAVQGAINLQAVGFAADRSKKILLEFGNALAGVGRGREDLNEVIRQLGQLASRGKVTADNLKPILERVPQAAAIIRKEFGTIDTEVLQKMEVSSEQFINALISGLEKLPRTTGGVKNDLENFSDTVQIALADIGKALLPVVKAVIDNLVPAIQGAAAAFSSLSPEVQNFVVISAGIAAAVGPVLLIMGGMVRAAIDLKVAVGTLSAVLGGFSTALNLSKGMLLGWLGVIATGVTSVGALVYALNQYANAQKQVKTAEADRLRILQDLRDRLVSHTNATREQSRAVRQLDEDFHAGNISIDQYQSGMQSIAKAIGDTVPVKQAASGATRDYSQALEGAAQSAEKVRVHLEPVQEALHRLHQADHQKSINDIAEALYLVSKYGSEAAANVAIMDESLRDLPTIKTTSDVKKLKIGIEGLKDPVAEVTTEWDKQIHVINENADAVIGTGKVIKQTSKTSSRALQEVSTIINDMSRNIARSIIDWQGFGDFAKSTLKSIGEAILRELIQNLLESTKIIPTILKGLDAVLSKIPGLGKIFGGASSASDVYGDMGGIFKGGGGTGGIGSIVSSGIMGTVGAIGSIASGISGIIGNFQSARQEGTLNAIEHEVRYSQIHLSYILEEVNKYLNYLKSIHDRLFEIRMEGVMVQQNPAWGDFRVAMAGGGGMGGGEVNVSIGTYVGPGGMSQFVDLLVSELRKRGVKFG